MTVDEVTDAVIIADDDATFASPRRRMQRCTEIAAMESRLAIAGDCVSAFRLRAARLRLQAAIRAER